MTRTNAARRFIEAIQPPLAVIRNIRAELTAAERASTEERVEILILHVNQLTEAFEESRRWRHT